MSKARLLAPWVGEDPKCLEECTASATVGAPTIATKNRPTSKVVRDCKLTFGGDLEITSQKGFTGLSGMATLSGNKVIDDVVGTWVAKSL